LYKIPASTLFIGKKLVYVPECHSTNVLAAALCLRTAVPEGTLVITDHQVSGRGQRGNEWISEPKKNLTFSIILRPVFIKPFQQFYLTMAVSLGLIDYLKEQLGDHAHIKWPNDILLKGKKTCGILIENTITGDIIQQSIVGIGLNVNQEIFSFASATSMKQISGVEYTLSIELSRLLPALEKRYLQLRAGEISQIKNSYLHCLRGKDEKRKFETAGGLIEGTIRNIDESGKLMVETGGQVRKFDLKEIRWVG
jgi:BirA family biotin operon repressor/biotin-[acetyl-CoA-carboxylase] ligase